jgi:hypothetical protein
MVTWENDGVLNSAAVTSNAMRQAAVDGKRANIHEA